jgi:hypothetical protein
MEFERPAGKSVVVGLTINCLFRSHNTQIRSKTRTGGVINKVEEGNWWEVAYTIADCNGDHAKKY